MTLFHFHWIDGSDFNDHKSIGDIEFETLDEAVDYALEYWNEEFQDKLEIREEADLTQIYYPDEEYEKGFEFAITIEEIEDED